MRTLPLAVLLLATACRGIDDAPTRESLPAAAIAPIGGARLADALELMDRELVAAMEDRLEGDGMDSFLRAEAISDRLLETQYPFQWMNAGSYSVDARLRQVQSLADRVLAQVRSGAPREHIVQDLQLLRRSVQDLRRGLTQGGGPAPPPLDRLLAGRDTLDLQGGEAVGGE